MRVEEESWSRCITFVLRRAYVDGMSERLILKDDSSMRLYPPQTPYILPYEYIHVPFAVSIFKL
jgi:hypothetical protein